LEGVLNELYINGLLEETIHSRGVNQVLAIYDKHPIKECLIKCFLSMEENLYFKEDGGIDVINWAR
jgi:hypothetical protein